MHERNRKVIIRWKFGEKFFFCVLRPIDGRHYYTLLPNVNTHTHFIVASWINCHQSRQLRQGCESRPHFPWKLRFNERAMSTVVLRRSRAHGNTHAREIGEQIVCAMVIDINGFAVKWCGSVSGSIFVAARNKSCNNLLCASKSGRRILEHGTRNSLRSVGL